VGNGLDEARLKGWIMGEDWQVFEFGLGHEHSILLPLLQFCFGEGVKEGVAEGAGEESGGAGLGGGGETEAKVVDEVVEEGEFVGGDGLEFVDNLLEHGARGGLCNGLARL